MKHLRPSAAQSGSVFIVILVAVAMFAALSYAITQSSRSSTAQFSEDQTRIVAQEIIAYGETIASAVQKLRLSGCSEAQITFASHNGMSKLRGGTPYTYTPSGDGSCDVFSPNGGKVVPKLISSGGVEPETVPETWMHPQSFAVIPARVVGIGQDTATAESTDLLLWIGRLRPEVCIQINKQLGIPLSNVPEDSICGMGLYDGTFGACADPLGNAAAELAGKTAFCSQDNAADPTQIHFRQVLLGR